MTKPTRSAFALAFALAALGCGSSSSTDASDTQFAFAGASSSFVWFEFIRIVPLPAWLFQAERCDAYEEIGDCVVPRECPPPGLIAPEDRPEPSPTVYPGPIKVAWMSLAFDTFNGMSSASFVPPLESGRPILFDIAGSRDVPAYQAEFVIPPAITVTAPDLASSIAVDRSQGLTVRWDPMELGEVSVRIADSAGGNAYVACRARATAGELEFPPEVLGALPSSTTAEGRPGKLWISQEDVLEFEPKNWSLSFTVEGPTQEASVVLF